MPVRVQPEAVAEHRVFTRAGGEGEQTQTDKLK
jgi:hypothetical protein